MRSPAVVARILTVGVIMAFAGTVAAQQPYPNKPIRFISPNAPGGGTTLIARLVGDKLTEIWGQQVIVDNRPGGNGIIGGQAAARSSPDGYTLLSMATTHLITPILVPAPYDAIRDFVPVGTLSGAETILVLHPSVQASSLQQFITLAKARPGQLNYASSGGGSATHLAAVLFENMTGVKMQHISYKGGGPAVTDLIGGQVQLAFNNPINVIAHIRNGRLKAIAISGEGRTSVLPQVPTFAEAGLPDFDMKQWWGVIGPAATPKAIVDRLAAEFARILVMPDVVEKLAGMGMDPFISTPDQFAALMRKDTVMFERIIKSANIKIEN